MVKRRLFALFGVIMMLVCTLGTPAYAGDDESVTISSEQAAAQTKFVEQVKASAMTSSQGTYNKVVSIDGTTYYVNNETFKIVKEKVTQYENSMQSADDASIDAAKQRVKNMSNGLNLGADTETGAAILSGVAPFIETVLGVMVYVVTAGMTVFTVCDLCYIYIPTFREKTSEMANKGGAMGKTSKETGETKFRFVTDEALYAVQTCSVETGKHPASVWIKKRIWAYILLGLALFILLTGNITLIVNIVLNIVGGLAGALQSLGA